MTEKEYQKAKELISEFKNGERLYKESALFNRVIQSMARGVSEIEIIEHLIHITEDTIKAQEFYMANDTRPFVVPRVPRKNQ